MTKESHQTKFQAGVGIRILGGIIIGVLIIPVVISILIFVPTIIRLTLYSPIISNILVMGGAFFLGGFIGRLLAGPHLSRGWIGIICALIFIGILAFLPHYHWNHVPGQGWIFVGAKRDISPPHATNVYNYIAFYALILFFGTGLAWLGDRIALRRWNSTNSKKINSNEVSI